MKKLKFWKYEGAGNDFIMIDGRWDNLELPTDTIRALCDRHRGIGADGLMILLDQPGYDFRMRYFNSDGIEADTCGNGGRCITLFADHLGIGADKKTFIGRDGEHNTQIVVREGDCAIIELGMIDVNGFQYCNQAFLLNTGVPHYVEFVDRVNNVNVDEVGRMIRTDSGANVNFVEIIDNGIIDVRTYERGVEGETLACGTGATAAAIATYIHKQRNITNFAVNTRGGQLQVRFSTQDSHNFHDILLTGPARRVFEGQI